MKKQITPINNEVKLADDEFIVRKTDTKGRITYCNRTFMRITGYSEKELLHTQHNIVRHPDMPRGVFRFLWDTITQISYAKDRSFASLIKLDHIIYKQNGYMVLNKGSDSDETTTVSASGTTTVSDRNASVTPRHPATSSLRTSRSTRTFRQPWPNPSRTGSITTVSSAKCSSTSSQPRR
jgi:hypothetical protein